MSLQLNGTAGVTYNDGSNQPAAASPYGLKNLIINGDMRIDQRNAGASVTQNAGASFITDRFYNFGTVTSKFTSQQVSDAPDGFNYSLKNTSSSSYTVGSAEQFWVVQKIEGYNIAHLGWGTANAKTVTLSFWVKSSLTGTFGGSLTDISRSYPFSYIISTANTWEKKTITIDGDTSGTWTINNGTGVGVYFSLGSGSNYQNTSGSWYSGNYKTVTGETSVVGTSGATFYITGVQLEIGDTATPFEYRMYGTELALCQRYYYKIKGTGGGCLFATGWNGSTTVGHYSITLPVTMRTYPTALETSGTASHYQIVHTNTATACNGVPTYGGETTPEVARVNAPVASGLTAGQGSGVRAGDIAAYLAWSAEL